MAAVMRQNEARIIAIVFIFFSHFDVFTTQTVAGRHAAGFSVPFGLALSTISGRYCASSLSVWSTGNPRWRANSCTWALPSTAFN